MATWHPDAKKDTYSHLGTFTMNVPPRIVWHTTEGTSLPRYSGSAPHFTLNPRTGDLWQHIPINCGALTLKNQGGRVETNRARAIQIELIGFAKDTPNWPSSYYDEIADLARWIERNADVPRKCTVDFVAGRKTMSGSQWLNYTGHCGHQHVPENDHWDPGNFRIQEVLDARTDAHRVLKVTGGGFMTGPDITAFQRAINKRARGCCRPDRKVKVDGVYGPKTRDNGAWGAYILGIGDSTDELKRGGISVYVQKLMRDPDDRNDTQKERAAARRARYCKCG